MTIVQTPPYNPRGTPSSADEAAESAAFFERWKIYRKIIEYNYMGHDEIAVAVQGILTKT